MIVAFVDEHKASFGVEVICRDLQIGSSSDYAHRARPPSPRSVTDAATTAVIKDVHSANYAVYGVGKIHAELNRRDYQVARCTVALMTLFETPQFCSLKFPTRVAPPRRAGPP